ncbi:MAG: methyltransferase family protein [Promethearchaeota archaeon]
MEYLVIILGASLFGLQHSGISALRVKNKIIDRLGKQGYSRIFTITSIVTLLIPFIAMDFWNWLYPIASFESYHPVQVLVAGLLIASGAVLAMKASSVISVSTVADMRSDRTPELITDGIYAKIRHPLYLATILLLVGLLLLYPFIEVTIFSLSLIAYTLIGSYFEERKLVAHYGEKYIEYRKTAGFILPKLRKVSS